MSDLGDVEIALDGKREALRCTLRAARTVSAISGGFVGALEGISGYRFETYVSLIATGLEMRNAKDVERIEDSVFKTGLQPLAEPLTRYVQRLMNGGRDPGEKVEGDSGKE